MASLYDLVDNLPTIGSLKVRATNYAMTEVSTLVTEARNKVATTIGSSASVFSGLTSGGTAVLPNYTATPGSVSSVTYVTPVTESQASIDNFLSSSTTGNFDYQVKLDDTDGGLVVFANMPEISESRSVEYEALAPPQMPGEFMKYKGTKATTWIITATITCRTRTEAEYNFLLINQLRAWSMTFFGDKQSTLFNSTSSTSQVNSQLGAPPPVVMFSGYRTVIGPVPTVITSLSWNWPRDCDWIPTLTNKIPFPTVMNITINLTESFSPDQFNNFDLNAFKRGEMVNAFMSGPTARSSGEAEGGSTGVSGNIQPKDTTAETTASSTANATENKPITSSVVPAPTTAVLTQQTQSLQKLLDSTAAIQRQATSRANDLKKIIAGESEPATLASLQADLAEELTIAANAETKIDSLQEKLLKLTGN